MKFCSFVEKIISNIVNMRNNDLWFCLEKIDFKLIKSFHSVIEPTEFFFPAPLPSKKVCDMTLARNIECAFCMSSKFRVLFILVSITAYWLSNTSTCR